MIEYLPCDLCETQFILSFYKFQLLSILNSTKFSKQTKRTKRITDFVRIVHFWKAFFRYSPCQTTTNETNWRLATPFSRQCHCYVMSNDEMVMRLSINDIHVFVHNSFRKTTSAMWNLLTHSLSCTRIISSKQTINYKWDIYRRLWLNWKQKKKKWYDFQQEISVSQFTPIQTCLRCVSANFFFSSSSCVSVVFIWHSKSICVSPI